MFAGGEYLTWRGSSIMSRLALDGPGYCLQDLFRLVARDTAGLVPVAVGASLRGWASPTEKESQRPRLEGLASMESQWALVWG